MSKMTDKLRIIFMGTPDFSVSALRNLIANPRMDVVAVYTQPPRPAGRGQQLRPSPIHSVADEHSIPVFTPKSLKKDAEAVRVFVNHHADVAVVAAYGLILPKAVLEAPRYGCLNIHASLLPRWRGAAPIHRAIEAGDTESGITIMQMEEGLDTGPMLLKKAVALRPTTTTQTLHDELSALGSAMIEDVLEMILDSKPIHPEMQDDSLSCYAPMIKKEEGLIDWTHPADVIDRKIRALHCYTLDAQGKRMKILAGYISPSPLVGEGWGEGSLLNGDGDILCGHHTVYRVTQLQPENSKAMDIKSALNGKKIAIGDQWHSNAGN